MECISPAPDSSVELDLQPFASQRPFTPGARVVITRGSLAGLRGQVIHPTEDRCLVETPTLGGGVLVRIRPDSVEPERSLDRFR
jgi:hypothetical protein